jgi:3-(methylthio)propanoyl-CoA dehydrogenase
MHRHLSAGSLSLARVVEFMVAKVKTDPNAAFAGSVPYLKLAGIVLGGWQMARALLVASDKRAEDESFYGAKIATAQFFAEHVLSMAPGIEASVVSADGRQGVLALSADQF